MANRTLLFLSTAFIAVLLWLTSVPLGVPGEWTWNRHHYTADGAWLLLAADIAVASVSAAVYLGFAFWMSKRVRRVGLGRLTAALIVLLVLAWMWVIAVQRCTPTEHAALKPTWVLFDPASSGYFFEARTIRNEMGEFLSGYEQRMSQGDVLHEGTHPPGLYLMHAGFLNACDSYPQLSRSLLAVFPADSHSAFTQLERHARLARPLSESELAALWLSSIVTEFLAVLTIVPLFILLCRWTTRTTAWCAILWWPLLPATVIFLPKSDALYPVIAALLLLLSDCALTSNGQYWRGIASFLAGVVLFIGLMLTLAFLPVAAAAAGLAVWRFQVDHVRPPEIAKVIGIAASGFALPIIALWVGCDLDMLTVWMWNLSNHSSFYSQFPRTYWKWLLVNIPEPLIAIGLPLVLWNLPMGRAQLPSPTPAGAVNESSTADHRLIWMSKCVFGVIWLLLWISGKNSGEAGRLWIILMPWAVIAFARDDSSSSRTALAMQAVFCIVVASRISGFQFAG